MSADLEIPENPHDIIPGKDKSLVEIDETQRRQEAAIEIQNAYRTYPPAIIRVKIARMRILGK
jgi:hypothetical protein